MRADLLRFHHALQRVGRDRRSISWSTVATPSRPASPSGSKAAIPISSPFATPGGPPSTRPSRRTSRILAGSSDPETRPGLGTRQNAILRIRSAPGLTARVLLNVLPRQLAFPCGGRANPPWGRCRLGCLLWFGNCRPTIAPRGQGLRQLLRGRLREARKSRRGRSLRPNALGRGGGKSRCSDRQADQAQLPGTWRAAADSLGGQCRCDCRRARFAPCSRHGQARTARLCLSHLRSYPRRPRVPPHVRHRRQEFRPDARLWPAHEDRASRAEAIPSIQSSSRKFRIPSRQRSWRRKQPFSTRLH